jgi:hypothetical protein
MMRVVSESKCSPFRNGLIGITSSPSDQALIIVVLPVRREREQRWKAGPLQRRVRFIMIAKKLLSVAEKIRKVEKNFKGKKILRCKNPIRTGQFEPLEMRSSLPTSPAVERLFDETDAGGCPANWLVLGTARRSAGCAMRRQVVCPVLLDHKCSGPAAGA